MHDNSHMQYTLPCRQPECTYVLSGMAQLLSSKDGKPPTLTHSVTEKRWWSCYTVQLRGKLTLASESLASATAYTRECERGHSRTSVECSRVLHPSLACYSRVLDPSLASARPLARMCYSRVLDRSLACVLVASAGSSPAQRAPR